MSGQMNYTGLQVDHRFWQLTQVPQGHQKRSTGWRGGEGTDAATISPHLNLTEGGQGETLLCCGAHNKNKEIMILNKRFFKNGIEVR